MFSLDSFFQHLITHTCSSISHTHTHTHTHGLNSATGSDLQENKVILEGTTSCSSVLSAAAVVSGSDDPGEGVVRRTECVVAARTPLSK